MQDAELQPHFYCRILPLAKKGLSTQLLSTKAHIIFFCCSAKPSFVSATYSFKKNLTLFFSYLSA